MKSPRIFASVLFVSAMCAVVNGQRGPVDNQPTASFRGRGALLASPALSPDELTVYTASANGTFYALTSDGLQELWNIRIPGGIRSSPMVAEDGTIYIGSENGSLYSITDLGTNGIINWRFRTGDRIKTSPAMDEDGVLYVASHDERLYALAAEDGGVGKTWAFNAETPILGSPTIAPDGTIYIVAGTNLIGVTPSGTEAGRFTAPKYAATTAAVATDGTVYFGANDERVWAVDPTGGTNGVRWRFNTGDDVLSSPSIGVNGRVYIGSDSGRVYCITTNGAIIWQFRTRGPVRSSAAIGADGTIYIGSDSRRFYAITADGDELWSFRTAGKVRTEPCISSDGTVYFTAGRTIYAIWDGVESEESPWPMYRKDPQHTARADLGEPFIIEHPQSTTNAAGETVQFTVRATAATPLTYQWLFNGMEIDPEDNPTATNATLVIENVSPTNAGTYSVVVSTAFGEVESEEAELVVTSVPIFTMNLTNHVVAVGSVLTLEVTAVGDMPLTYQWYKNGTPLEGATNRTLTITNSVPGTDSYFVIVKNPLGETQSTTAQVTAIVVSLTRAADTVAAGNQFSAAVVTNQLFTWGNDLTGQLGDGGIAPRNSPTRTSTNTDWLAVSAGGVGYTQTTNGAAGHAVAVRLDGRLYAWGANARGQVGNNATNDQRTPVRIGVETNWIQAEAGAAHSVALRGDGTIWTWGANDFGQLGLGTTNDVRVPTQVGRDSAWVEVRAGGSFTLARRADNTLWAWGRNESGQLGIGTTTNSRSPVQVGTSTNWQRVSAGASHSLAIQTDGSLWSWGRDFGYTLNSIYGSNNITRVPAQVGAATSWIAISAGYNHSLAIDSGNRMYAWGANNVGQLGNGLIGPTTGQTNSANVAAPTQIAPERGWSDVDAGVKHSLARSVDGSIWAWGWNNSGQIGDGTGGDGTEANNRTVPVLLTFTNVSGVVTNITPTGPPSITQQPASVQGTSGSNVTFTVAATGAPPLFYQWRFNTNAIPGATNTLLTVTGAATNAGAYDVVITNSAGSVTSTVASLTFSNSAPVITQQPVNRTVVTNSTSGFEVVAAGSEPLRYQWYHMDALLTGATNRTLVISNAQYTNAGPYHVVVMNAFGQDVSDYARLTVTNTPSGPPGPPTGASLPAPSPAIGSLSVSPNGIQIPVGESTRPFVLEYKNSLEDPEWIPLSTNQTGTATNLMDSPAPGPSRFYRVRLQ